MNDIKMSDADDRVAEYQPHHSERIIAMVMGAITVAVILYLAIRNEPFADPNLVVFLRILLSVSAALVGATIPGFLHVSWKASGLALRAGGALALVVLTLILTPTVIERDSDELSQLQISTEPPAYADSRKVPLGAEFLLKASNVPADATLSWSEPLKGTIEPRQGSVVRYTAPRAADARGEESVTVDIELLGRRAKKRFDFEIVPPF